MSQHTKSFFGLFAVLTLFLGGGCMPQVEPKVTQIEQPASPPPAESDTSTASEAPVDSETSIGSKTVTSTYGFSFLYPGTYVLQKNETTEEQKKKSFTDLGFDVPQDAYTLTLATDVRPEGFAGEGPPSINIIYWTNEKKLSLVEWGKKNSAYSGFHEGVPIYTKETIQGHAAIRYKSDGLYMFQSVLIEHGDGVLLLDVADESSHPNAETFEVILKNLKLGQ